MQQYSKVSNESGENFSSYRPETSCFQILAEFFNHCDLDLGRMWPKINRVLSRVICNNIPKYQMNQVKTFRVIVRKPHVFRFWRSFSITVTLTLDGCGRKSIGFSLVWYATIFQSIKWIRWKLFELLEKFSPDSFDTLEYCCISHEREPYWFSATSVQGQGHSDWKTPPKSQNMRFPDDNSKSFHLIHLILWNIVAYHTRENPIDFRPHPSKVKVTVIEKLRQNLKTWGFRTITRKVFTWFIWYFGILLHITRERTLLIFGHIRPRSKWPWTCPPKIWKEVLSRVMMQQYSKVFTWFRWFSNIVASSHEKNLIFSDFGATSLQGQGHSDWKTPPKSQNMRFPDDNSKSFHLIHLILWNIVAYHTRENPIDFRPHPSKVKVTVIEKLRQNLKTWGFRTITRKVFTWFIWYFGILLHITRERTLLIFGHIRPRSRSQWLKNSAKIWKHEVSGR